MSRKERKFHIWMPHSQPGRSRLFAADSRSGHSGAGPTVGTAPQ
jgi:hypothetical protein